VAHSVGCLWSCFTGKSRQPLKGAELKIKLHYIAAVFSILVLACTGFTARAQESREDLSPCAGSAPEPSQSATWSVAFCNRTGHDLVIEFHDNECPANDWTRRGDVYQRTLKRGESRTLPLCYANEPAGKKPTPGIPTLHIPGGKGVTTTWNVVGDCGDHSKSLNLDARGFYDRGDYKTGIILLQHPSGASHCMSDGSATAAGAASSGAAVASAGAIASAPGAASAAQVQPPVATHSPIVAPPAAAAPPAVPRTSGAPTLTATVDKSGLIQHSVQIFATGGAGYKCTLNLLVTFSDGATWNDKVKAAITGNDEQVPIVTRKYMKTPTAAKITSNSCAPG
jgi:hypothetical protein